MGKTNFSGPVRSMRGFVTAGPDSVVGITAETTLTFADHAGKVIESGSHETLIDKSELYKSFYEKQIQK